MMRISDDSRIASVARAEREEPEENEADLPEMPSDDMQEDMISDAEENLVEPVLDPKDALSDLDMDLPDGSEETPEDDI